MARRTIINSNKSGGLNPETRRWLVALVLLAAGLSAYGLKLWTAPPDGPIVGTAYVIDGDTVSISGRHIRLVDIDAPELAQTCQDGRGKAWPCGRSAAMALRGLVRRHELSCRTQAYDQYHRVLAVCSLPVGTDVNAWMVQQGLAVTSGFSKIYGIQEAEARAARRGLWTGDFTSPREWRRQHPRDDQAGPKG
jgi:endonuclease YncB( thermonuclease family)